MSNSQNKVAENDENGVGKDIVLDINVIRLYNNPADPLIRALFKWLAECGTLVVNQKLVSEYIGTGNYLLAGLINELIAKKRFVRIEKNALESFSNDKNFNYTCNGKDIQHARTVFLSKRKRLVSFDNPLVADVNNFPKVNKIKPQATRTPDQTFYE